MLRSPSELDVFWGDSMAGLNIRDSDRTRRGRRALYGGLGKYSSRVLAAIVADDGDLPSDRIILAWQLAHYYAENGNFGDALDMLALMRLLAEQNRMVLTPRLQRAGSTLEIDLATHCGDLTRAKSVLANLYKVMPEGMEHEFLEANIALAEGVTDDRRLAGINRKLQDHGLAPLVRRDSSTPIAIGNVKADALVLTATDLPKVSVIMPAYNCSNTISVALDGLLAQTWKNIEILVVNDASPDDVGEIIADYSARDSRVVAINHAENGGAYAARNSGLSAATGQFITVNDADDWVHPQRLEVQMQALLASGHAANYSDGIRCQSDLSFKLKHSVGSFTFKNMSSVIYRRENLDELGGWHISRVAADSELISRHELKFGPIESVLPGVPLSLVLASETSLTKHGPTSIASLNYGARREYKSAYLHWHSQQALPSAVNDQQAVPTFSIPAICKPGETVLQEFDVLHVGCSAHPDADDLIWSWRGKSHQGFFDWPVEEFMHNGRSAVIQDSLNSGLVQAVVWGEKIICDTVIVHHSLPAIPDQLPEIEARKCIVLADDKPTLANIQATFGLNPIVDAAFSPVAAFDPAATIPTRIESVRSNPQIIALKDKIKQLEQKRLALR